jgi:hypothetical protein
MILGVDFDNTIVDYDVLFHRIATEAGVVPLELPPLKQAVRDHLRAVDREHVWTELQGRVYGERMADAAAYPGALEFLRECKAAGIPVRIISHKTREPFLGPKYDLHAAARAWLTQSRVFAPDGAGLADSEVFFELTKEAKLARIASEGCTHFIDDLPELLCHPQFPPGVVRILFSPMEPAADATGLVRLARWQDAATVIAAATLS